MSKPKLFIFVGAPGAGKTTAARLIQQLTGAVHLWADNERWKMFDRPSHSAEESRRLYDHLNQTTSQLLEAGKSVIFDTNFNHLADRDLLRQIARDHKSEVVLIWLTTPDQVAHERAVHSDTTRNGYTVNMTHEMYENIVSKLEPPTEDENPIKIDGTKLDAATIKQHLDTT